MTRDTKYSIIAMLSGFAVFGLLLALEFEGADLAGAGRKWFQLVLWTGFVFVLVGYHRRKSLKRTKPLLMFVALLALHVMVFASYLRAEGHFPNVFFLIFSPLDAVLVTLGVGVVSGNVGFRKRAHRRPGADKDL